MTTQPNFVIDVDNFRLVREEVGMGQIKELSAADAGLVTPHIQGHPETLYVACSGVNLSGKCGVFDSNEQQVAVEWIRHETKPKPERCGALAGSETRSGWFAWRLHYI